MIEPGHLVWIARFISAAAGGQSGSLVGELREVCEHLGRNLEPPRLIRRPDGQPYLERYYLVGGPVRPRSFDDNGAPFPGTAWAQTPVSLFVHHLRSSDERAALHNHPWTEAASLILAGGYSEDRRAGDRVVTRRVAPLEVNTLSGEDFHRIDLVEDDAWSFFVAGQATRRWYFWDPRTGVTTAATGRRAS